MLKRITTLLATIMLAVGIMLCCAPATALAATIVREGTAGNTSWTIDDAGELVITPIEGTDGVLADDYVADPDAGEDADAEAYFSWYPYASSIVSVTIEDGVSATSLAGIFSGCMALSEADLTGLDTADVIDMSDAFNGCFMLRTIYVGDGWTTENVTESDGMFTGCTLIAGGNGTTYAASRTDATYARVDSEGAPGYFVAEGDDPVHMPGWDKEGGAYYFYELNGTRRTSAWLNFEGSWYYFDKNGNPLSYTWFKYGGAYYAFGKDGKLITSSWIKQNGKYYYVGADGKALVNQRVQYKGVYYYFGSQGYLVTASSSSKVGSLNAMISAAKRTPTTGAGGCARWVTNVFTNAGIGTWNGSARDMYNMWCTSSNYSDLKPGMIIAVASTGGSYAAYLYGHVGIYLGNGVVMHNLKGVVGTMSLSSWISMLGGYSTPRWGWLGGVVLY